MCWALQLTVVRRETSPSQSQLEVCCCQLERSFVRVVLDPEVWADRAWDAPETPSPCRYSLQHLTEDVRCDSHLSHTILVSRSSAFIARLVSIFCRSTTIFFEREARPLAFVFVFRRSLCHVTSATTTSASFWKQTNEQLRIFRRFSKWRITFLRRYFVLRFRQCFVFVRVRGFLEFETTENLNTAAASLVKIL